MGVSTRVEIAMLLLIDNYDSFAHNLTRLGADVCVVRNDAMRAQDVLTLGPAAIVLSPGPCTPNEAGCSLELVRCCGDQLPILGVCLGHQVIVAALGGQIVRVDPMHGRTSTIRHDGHGVFQGVPNPFIGCRYHSLAAERSSLPPQLEVTAETEDGVIMAVRHRERPIVGLQFHPEAILTEHGYTLLANFLRIAQVDVTGAVPSAADELRSPASVAVELPRSPVTF